jgi:hypothetical protein
MAARRLALVRLVTWVSKLLNEAALSIRINDSIRSRTTCV